MENNQTPILSDEDFEKLKQRGVSDEEIRNLKVSLNLVNAANTIPEDINAFLEKIENYFPKDDVQKTIAMFFELAEKDPEFFTQIVAMQALLGVEDSPIEDTHIGDALRQIRAAETNEQKEELTNELVARIKKLTPATKAAFLAEMQSLKVEDKKMLLDILNKR